MRARQLSFLPPPEREYGGGKRKGRRKIQRPFDPKRPLHLTLRSSVARGPWSLLGGRNRWHVLNLLKQAAETYNVRVYRFANVGNHLHLLIQVQKRSDLQAFLREFAGRVAASVTGAIKGRPQKFWDELAYTKIVDWGRQFANTARHILLNVLEATGRRDVARVACLETEGILWVAPE